MCTQVTLYDEQGVPMNEVPFDPAEHAHLCGGTVQGARTLRFFIWQGLTAIVQHPATGEYRLVAL